MCLSLGILQYQFILLEMQKKNAMRWGRHTYKDELGC